MARASKKPRSRGTSSQVATAEGTNNQARVKTVTRSGCCATRL